MDDDPAVAANYRHDHLLEAIRAALDALGKTPETLTIDDLAPVDEFHIGGRVATEHLLERLDPRAGAHLLDVGCGLGGAARFVAQRYGCRVSGIDLTPEYVDAGNALCGWVGLDAQVALRRGSALAMPFGDASFDGAYMLHVGMNIGDKAALFAEIHRVLRPGAKFGLYDVMRVADGELRYPVPWAMDEATSRLATPGRYRQALVAAGFDVVCEDDRRAYALAFFEKLRAKAAGGGAPAPLGLHLLMQATSAARIGNMIANIASGCLAPVEIVSIRR